MYWLNNKCVNYIQPQTYRNIMNVDNVFEQAWLCIYVYVHYVLFWLGMEHVNVYIYDIERKMQGKIRWQKGKSVRILCHSHKVIYCLAM